MVKEMESKTKIIRYCDLFAGVGGFRIGIENAEKHRIKQADISIRDGKPKIAKPTAPQQSLEPEGQSISSIGNIAHNMQPGDSRKIPHISSEGGKDGIEDATTSTRNKQGTPKKSKSGASNNNKPVATQQFTCVYSNEWDKYANSVYKKHYGECNISDIRDVEASHIPDFDLLCGGFPCQSFSIAGKRGGFADTRGTLFFEIARIIKQKQPRLLLLENVKGLLSHDKGRTFTTIISTLDELGYDCQWQVLNSKNLGVPQNRERVFIIGHLRGTPRPEVFPILGTDPTPIETKKLSEPISNCLRTNYSNGHSNETYIRQLNQPKHSNDRIYSSEGISPTLNTAQGGMRQPKIVRPVLTPDRAEKRQNGRRFKEDGDPAFTVTAQDQHGVAIHAMQWRRTAKGREARRENQKKGHDYTPFSDGHRELVPKPGKVVGAITAQAVAKDSLLGNDTQIRRLTPTECERLQGFPDGWTSTGRGCKKCNFIGDVMEKNDSGVLVEVACPSCHGWSLISDTQRYKMMGNAVSTPVVTEIIKKLMTSYDKDIMLRNKTS